MTTPTPLGGLGRAVGPVRMLAAWALVGFTALVLFFAILQWIVPVPMVDFTEKSRVAFYTFTGLEALAMPVLAALLAAYVTPALGAARLIATIALLEYAVALAFGALTFLIGLGAAFSANMYGASTFLSGVNYLVLGLGKLALLAVAGLVVLRIFTEVGGQLPSVGGRQSVPPQPPA